ncbi:MAG: hypothetical protein AAGA87_02565 [Pseudomonadota bacterium]
MAARQLSPVGQDLRTDPIRAIAEADLQSRPPGTPTDVPVIDTGPDLVEPSRPLAPQGMAGLVDEALGSVKLPTLLELANALEDMAGYTSRLADIDPAMAEVAQAVLSDEQAKVLRYVDLRDR